MRRRSTTTGLMVDASQVLQEMVGMLSYPERGAAIFASGHVSRRVASWRTRAESLRSKIFRVPSGFLSEISAVMMSGGQGCCHTRLVPKPPGFRPTPPPPRPDARGVAESHMGRFSADDLR